MSERSIYVESLKKYKDDFLDKNQIEGNILIEFEKSYDFFTMMLTNMNFKHEIIIKSLFFITKVECLLGSPQEAHDPFYEIFIQSHNQTEPEKNINLSEIIKCIKEIVKILQSKLSEKSFNSISNYVADFDFSNNMFSKLENILNLFFDQSSDYNTALKNLVWNVFVYLRTRLSARSQNFLECIPLMICVSSMILNKLNPDHLPLSITKNLCTDGEEYEIEKQRISLILQTICNNIGFKYDEKNSQISDYTDRIKNELGKMKELAELGQNMFSLVEIDLIKKNTKVFQNLYPGMLKFSHFDERQFSYNLKGDISPIKRYPYKLDHFTSQLDKQKPTFRALDFSGVMNQQKKDSEANAISSMNMQSGKFATPFTANSSHFNRNLGVSPIFNQNAKDYRYMTPCTRTIEMDTWLNKYAKEWNKENLNNFVKALENPSMFESKLQLYFSIIYAKLEDYHIKLITSKDTIRNLCLKIITQLLIREEKNLTKNLAVSLLVNDNFIKAVVIISFELVFFIENCIELHFLELVKFLSLDLYEFWKIMNPAYKFDYLIPNTIRIHFSTIEVQIFTLFIWREKNSFRSSISDFFKLSNNEGLLQLKISLSPEQGSVEKKEFNNQSLFVYYNKSDFEKEIASLKSQGNPDEKTSQLLETLKKYSTLDPINVFIRRAFNYCIWTNYDLCKQLKYREEIAKSIEEKLKIIFHSCVELLFDKHLDQIIVCSIYFTRSIYLKIETEGERLGIDDQSNKFNGIVNCYKMIKNEDSTGKITKSIFYNVKHSTKSYDIIQFYNDVFLPIIGKKLLPSSEEKPAKKRRGEDGDPSSEVYSVQKKLQFDNDSAFGSATVVYEPVKSTSGNASGMTPSKYGSMSHMGYGMSGAMTPDKMDLTKTPRTSKVRSLLTDYMVQNEPFSYSDSPKKATNSIKDSLKSKLLKLKPTLSQGINAPLPETTQPLSKILETSEESTTKTLTFSDQDSKMPIEKEKEDSSQQGTPEFSKYNFNK